MQVSFQTPTYRFLVEFNQTLAAREITKNLPLDSKVEVWGDEIYCKSGIMAPGIPMTLDVGVGDVAYWPEEKCICVFFGRTPRSTADKPVPAGPVVIIGKTLTDIEELRQIKAGDAIKIVPMETKPPVPETVKDYSPDRKLTQEEIDVLVRQLLAEKKKKENNKM